MGNNLCGTNKKKNKDKKFIKKIEVTNPKPGEHPRVEPRKKSEAVLQIPAIKTKMVDLHNKDVNQSKQNQSSSSKLSFLQSVDKGGELFSFLLYGEDISKVRNTALFDLKNLKDMTMRISKNELLLLTEDNIDIRNILKSKNIDMRALRKGLNEMSGNNSVLKLTDKAPLIGNTSTNFLNDKNLPEYVKVKYNKMVHKSRLDSNIYDDKLLTSSIFMQDEILQNDGHILSTSDTINKKGVRAEVWNPDVHEIVIFDEAKTEMLGFGDGFMELENIAKRSNIIFNKLHQSNPVNPVFSNKKPIIEELVFKSFKNQQFLAILLNIINYDTVFETNLMKRIIYPQQNGIAIRTPHDLYIVKLHINGSRRAVVIQQGDISGNTVNNEAYPVIIKRALKMAINDITKSRVTTLVFRICNWIPETLSVKDIGDAFSSYDKLKDTFTNGNLILFFNIPNSTMIKPILNFVENNKTLKKYIKTTSDGSEDNFILLDWEELYNSGNLEYLYINWNPTIYPFRASAHVRIPMKFDDIKSEVFSPRFNFLRKTQLLLSVFPHNEPCETRIIIEKHRNALNINCKIKYYLYHFYNGRMALKQSSLKEMIINESNEEILSDIIVFDKNTAHENYVIVLDLEPEDKKNLKYYKSIINEIVTVTVYSFAQFEIIEMPFKKIDNFMSTKVPYVDSNETVSGVEQQRSMNNPIIKMTCNYTGYYEIRVEGREDVFYGISIFNYNNYRNSIQQNQALKFSPETYKGLNSLSFKLELGTYAVMISVERNSRDEQEMENNSLYKKNSVSFKIPKHDIKVYFISYSDRLVKSVREHLPPKDNFSISELHKKFKIENLKDNVKKLKIKKLLHGSWNSLNNMGTNRAKVDCYQKFMKNPGYIITTEEDAKVNFLLKAHKSSDNDNAPFISISVLTIDNDFKFKYLLEDENYVQSYEYRSSEITLTPNKMGYLVLCLNLHQDWIGNFELEIMSDVKLKSIRETSKGLLKFHNEQRITGEFVKNSGGHYDNPSFLFNPCYIIHIENNKSKEVERFLAEMFLSAPEHPFSLYLFNTGKTSLSDMTTQEIQKGEFNPAFLYELNSLFSRLNSGQYLLVPSTLQTTEFPINFELKLTSNHRFKAMKTADEEFNLNFNISLQNKMDHSCSFILREKTKILIVISPEYQEMDLTVVLTDKTANTNALNEKIHLKDIYFHKALTLEGVNNQYELKFKSTTSTNFQLSIYAREHDSIEMK